MICQIWSIAQWLTELDKFSFDVSPSPAFMNLIISNLVHRIAVDRKCQSTIWSRWTVKKYCNGYFRKIDHTKSTIWSIEYGRFRAKQLESVSFHQLYIYTIIYGH